MIIELRKTTATAVGTELLNARRNLGAGSGLVFTLVVVCEAGKYAHVLDACMEAGREHPSRIIVLVSGRAQASVLDATIRTGEGIPGDIITLFMSGELARHAQSVVLPLLLPDSPVVVWWPNKSPEEPGLDPVGGLATRRITDASGAPHPLASLRTRAEHHVPGDTDLTWTRLTPWRALLAASLDQYPATILSGTIEATRDNAPAELMAAWLESRLHVPIEIKHSRGPGITAVRLETPAGDIAILREDGITASYMVPGQPRRSVALKRRDINELITEELRRMDADDIYEQATQALAHRADGPRPHRKTIRTTIAMPPRAESKPKRAPRAIAQVAPVRVRASEQPVDAASRKAVATRPVVKKTQPERAEP